MPNSFYYQLMGLSQPEVAVAEGVGRKPWKPKQTKAETREKYEETAVGYGLAIMLLAAELELTSVLKESFGEELGKKILTIAAFLCACVKEVIPPLTDWLNLSVPILLVRILM